LALQLTTEEAERLEMHLGIAKKKRMNSDWRMSEEKRNAVIDMIQKRKSHRDIRDELHVANTTILKIKKEEGL
jgi:hypothetical protein